MTRDLAARLAEQAARHPVPRLPSYEVERTRVADREVLRRLVEEEPQP